MPANAKNDASTAVSVNELLLAFITHANQHYLKHGRPTSELRSFGVALRPVKKLYGLGPVTDFGPLALTTCRQLLVEQGVCRKRVNQHVGRIRQVFKWGVARELVPEPIWRALCAVTGLRHGEARETRPVTPVAEPMIAAIRPFVSPQVWAMVQFQLRTGCRPGEACDVRPGDLIMSGEIWEYRPRSHKTQHHQKERLIFVGKQAQDVLRPFLNGAPDEFLFSPKESREWFLSQRKSNRKTPMTPSQRARRRKSNPARKPGNHFSTLAYGHAISKACEKAFKMPPELRRVSKQSTQAKQSALQTAARTWREQHCWSPNQLRHTAATRIRSAFGIEMARIILGHSSAVTSEIYAEIDREKAREVMAKLG